MLCGECVSDVFKYFDSKFPELFVEVYKVMEKNHRKGDLLFKTYFEQ